MHWLESLLVAFNLKRMLLDHFTPKDVPIIKSSIHPYVFSSKDSDSHFSHQMSCD
ncbi:hypothetical protein Fmac_021254 [Flemingia macrophylla]|uniref:Uncharacterized protein n=1 Tax=Flemingia macrophylla TaxID=520843 RepID=A0ABD1LWK0_9FABA